jgi:hypothetical protein
MVLYGPSGGGSLGRQFFDLVLLLLKTPEYGVDLHRILIAGDLNYSYLPSGQPSYSLDDWVAMTDEYLYNSMTPNDLSSIPTFQRPHLETSWESTIDYIFISQNSFAHHLIHNTVEKLNSVWTDHSLLTIQLEFKRIPLGPGLWKANPMLLQQKEFRDQLNRRLDYLAKGLDPSTSSQDNWGNIKVQVKRFIRSFGRRQASLRSANLDQLQKDRHSIFVSPSTANDHHQRLGSID